MFYTCHACECVHSTLTCTHIPFSIFYCWFDEIREKQYWNMYLCVSCVWWLAIPGPNLWKKREKIRRKRTNMWKIVKCVALNLIFFPFICRFFGRYASWKWCFTISTVHVHQYYFFLFTRTLRNSFKIRKHYSSLIRLLNLPFLLTHAFAAIAFLRNIHI